jgi:hypothetical protein
LTSKIINMAERIKDEKDRLLETMFASEPIADDGFSALVVRRVRRKVMLRRLSLPLAALIGGAIAFKPLLALAGFAPQLLQQLPDELVTGAADSLPALQLVITGGLLLFVAIMALNMIED